jgi:diadenosine tetraphosphate (Ap4A) HIT family hydrolase
MDDVSYLKLFQKAREISLPIKKAFDAPRIGLVIEGFYIHHVHLHLVPVYNVAELDPNRGKMTSLDDLVPIAEKLRSSFRVNL